MALKIDENKKAAPAVEPVVEAPAADGVVYGASRKDLAFVCPLGDPSQPDTTRVDMPDGTKDKKVTSTIVGYRFKVLKDMKVPNCGTNEGFKKDPMNYVDVENWVNAKAGEEILLTPFETALLLSQPEFNGGCDGGEKPVSCVYQTKKMVAKDGTVPTASAVATTPRVSLRAAVGSIKDFDIEDVLTFTEEFENGKKRKIRTIKDETAYAKWVPLTVAAARKSTGKAKAAADPTKMANKNAAAFLSFVASKKAK